ncbi:chromosome-associated kinesin KIF4 [Copidosoma floridanum]|uniref:chromosome-associated kinesin KIF4 n=1 Tax=Copidosoma floridanum TaxID=29053 RepID=UPI0006C98B93|nr:chromosome-associated kinesin KIF4 [Copidosoma floridanum]
MSEDLVKVAVRIRPLVQSEKEKGCQICLNVVPGEQQIQIPSTEKAFTFNYVFAPECSQEEFYETAIKNMISNIFEGYNVTILAYGQTGSGKTFSMGTNYDKSDADCGVIPRAVNDIFEIIEKKTDWEFKVTVAFMELYKEQLYDLLSKKPRNQCVLDIREDLRGIKIVGLSEIPVTNTQETLQCLADGSSNRATGATAMNVQSSRSHAIFTISVHQQKKNEPNSAKFAKFHLVDLAGSERSKKTQAIGERFKEGVNINKGLLALGNVISQLGEGGNSSYIGYRDSKLTRLLQDSLGGNSVTLMIACVSPANYNIDETTSTLRYADRAKKIKNKPIVNQDPRTAEIINLKKIIQELRTAMLNSDNGVSLCPPEHSELEDKVKSLQRKLRGVTETLSANLMEMVNMHELAELTEQSREVMKNAIASLLEDCESLLKDFHENPKNVESYRGKLENICMKIIDLQKEQKKANDMLVTHELSTDSPSNNTGNSESMSNSIEESSLMNETYDLDEKHEEHTLQQAGRVDEVQYINKQLAIKEELVSNLIKNSSQIAEYQKELEEMEDEIKTLAKERDELQQALRNAQTSNTSAKIAETRRKKVQELEKKIADLHRKVLEQNKVIKNKEKSDEKIKSLSNEILSLKQTKVRLIRNMRSETDKFNKWKRSREQELYKLKDQDRKRQNQITRLQLEHNKQKNVYKRKLEEAQAIQKRLKDALDLQKKAAQRREKATANVKEDVLSWVHQEFEVLLSTVDAEYTLEKLKKDRTANANRLAELQLHNESDSSLSNQAEIADLMEYVETRNTQIKDLEKHIAESNQDNRAKNRWHAISTIADFKMALKTLFEIVATNRREQITLQSTLEDLTDQIEKLKNENEEMQKYDLRNSRNLKFRKEYLNESNGKELVSDSEKDKKIKELENQIEELQQKVLTEKDCNVPDVKLKLRQTKSVREENEELDSFVLTDESAFEDDVENDPDWRKTPLFSRLRNLEKTNRNNTRESKAGLKRSSQGDIKCSCKTQCNSRLCSCRKNGITCENCNCNPSICLNRNPDNTRRTLFSDADQVKESTLETKKVKLEITSD